MEGPALAKAGAGREGDDSVTGGPPSLPLALQAEVLQLLPPDEVMLLNRVCFAFKAMVDQPGLYRDVRLGAGSGAGRFCDGLLLAISRKAKGTMRTLDLAGRMGGWEAPAVSVFSVAAVERVRQANAGALLKLNVCCEDQGHA